MRRLIPALALAPTTAFGAVLTVPTDYATFDAALAAAAANDRIEFMAGTYEVTATPPLQPHRAARLR